MPSTAAGSTWRSVSCRWSRTRQRAQLLKDRYIVLVRKGHPFTRKRRSGKALLEDLGLLEFVAVRTHADTLRILQLLNLEDRLRLTTEHFMVLPAIVRATDLAVVMPRNIAQGFPDAGGYTIVEPRFARCATSRCRCTGASDSKPIPATAGCGRPSWSSSSPELPQQGPRNPGEQQHARKQHAPQHGGLAGHCARQETGEQPGIRLARDGCADSGGRQVLGLSR